MKAYRRLIALLLILCLGLSGCGGAKSAAPMEQYAAGWGSDAAADYAVSEESGKEAPESAAAAVSRKLVRTVTLRVQTTDFDAAFEELTAKAAQLGGYIASSSVWGNAAAGDDRSGSFLIRIPAGRCDEFLAAAESAGNVTRRSEQLEDITTKYVDNAARLESLQIEQTRLQELLAQAASLEEILLLEERLSDVRAQLDSAERQQRYYDDQVDYATVELDLVEVKSLTPAKDDFVSQVARAFLDSFSGLAELLRTMILAVVYWWWAILAVCALVWALRRRRAKKREKQQAFRQETEPKGTNKS